MRGPQEPAAAAGGGGGGQRGRGHTCGGAGAGAPPAPGQAWGAADCQPWRTLCVLTHRCPHTSAAPTENTHRGSACRSSISSSCGWGVASVHAQTASPRLRRERSARGGGGPAQQGTQAAMQAAMQALACGPAACGPAAGGGRGHSRVWLPPPRVDGVSDDLGSVHQRHIGQRHLKEAAQDAAGRAGARKAAGGKAGCASAVRWPPAAERARGKGPPHLIIGVRRSPGCTARRRATAASRASSSTLA